MTTPKYKKWKDAFLATKEGQRLWDKYQNNKKFTLVIKIDEKIDNGAETNNYKFSDGKLVGATISLGTDIGDRADAALRSGDSYPLSKSLGVEKVDTNILAAAIIAHEFGHVEDASQRPDSFQALQEYSDLTKKKVSELGSFTAAYADSEVKKKGEGVLKAFGASNWEQVSRDNDNRAERTAIPVIQQSYANKGKKIPEGVQKAIDKLSSNK